MMDEPKSRPPTPPNAASSSQDNSLNSSPFALALHPLRLKKDQFENKKQAIAFFETAFRDQRTLFKLIVDNTPAVIYVKDLKGNYLLANTTCQKLFHFGDEEIHTKTDYDFFPKAMADNFRQNDLRVQREGKAIEFEEEASQDDGVHTYISLKFPIADTQGKICAVAGISTDITVHKRFETARQDAALYLDKIINSVADPIFVKDREHRWVLMNDSMCRLFGYSREQLIGKSDYEFFPKDQADVFWKKDEEVLLTGKENLNEEYFTDAQGKIHTIVTKKTLYDDGKGGKFIVGVIRDITEQKRAEQDLLQKTLELAKANAEKEYLELFACVASHDLQEPLQKIIAFGGLLKSHSSKELDEKGRSFVEKLQMAAMRMSRMIEDLLQFTRVSTGSEHFEQVDLEVVVGEVLSDLDLKISQFKSKVLVGNLPTLYGDRRQMHLLFLNLISNALKFQHENIIPEIKIESRSLAPGYVAIDVSDNGVGFDEKYLNKIFQPFERLHDRAEYEGNGIGLAICKKIVMRHGGTITAKSSTGRGAVFTVTLPGASSDPL